MMSMKFSRLLDDVTTVMGFCQVMVITMPMADGVYSGNDDTDNGKTMMMMLKIFEAIIVKCKYSDCGLSW
jgi:hypothetical protein